MEADNKIILDKINVNNNRVEYYFSTSGCYDKYFNDEKVMYIEYNYDIEDIPESILAIPFVANTIPFIWLCNGKIEIYDLDKSFYDSLESIKDGFKEMYPNISFLGSIQVNKITKNTYEFKHEAAQLFSGGLDALTTFIRIKEKSPYLITHCGADIKTENEEVWNVLKNKVEEFGVEYNVENIFIKSNGREFLNEKKIAEDFNKLLGHSWYYGIQHGLMLICFSIPLMIKFKVKTLYIASSNHEGNELDFGYIPSAGSDPRVDNKIKFASGDVFHDAYELDRVKKVKVIIDYVKQENKKLFLKVCHNQDSRTNCCNCEKCYRTIITIIAQGGDPNDFGFEINDDIGVHFKKFLDNEIINIGDDYLIEEWYPIKRLLIKNYSKINKKFNIEWFLSYYMKKERKKKIIIYRLKNFIPIIKRKIVNIQKG